MSIPELTEAQEAVLQENTRLVHESDLFGAYLITQRYYSAQLRGIAEDPAPRPNSETFSSELSQSAQRTEAGIYAELPFAFTANSMIWGIELGLQRVQRHSGHKLKYSDAAIGVIYRTTNIIKPWSRFTETWIVLAAKRVEVQLGVGLDRYSPKRIQPMLEQWLTAQDS